MNVRIALANLRLPASPEDSVALACDAIRDAGERRARIVCFPECFVPGYRGLGSAPPAPDPAFLRSAWERVASAAGRAGVAVVLGTERLTSRGLAITALVVDGDGRILGLQDKVQLDPSEEGTYTAGSGRLIFEAAGVTFGIAICHEAWRYPETVRWAARRGARVVFVPHFHPAAEGGVRPARFADPDGTFHEMALLCRAAENTCWVAAANCAGAGSSTTSAVVRPDGTLLCHQPYGQHGLLVADLDMSAATGALAARLRIEEA